MVRAELGVVFMMLIACGADEPSPVEKCDDFLSEVCDRGVECLGGGVTHAACIQELQAVVPCGSARDVTASYDRCMDQIRSFSCGVLFPTDPETGQPGLELPADCSGVIRVERLSPGVSGTSGQWGAGIAAE